MQRPTLYFSFAPNHPLTQTSFSPQLSRLQALQKRASSVFFSRHERERAFEKRGFLLLRRPPCPIASSEDVPGKESEGGSPLSLRLRRRKGGGGGRRNTKGSAGEEGGEGREAERHERERGRLLSPVPTTPERKGDASPSSSFPVAAFFRSLLLLPASLAAKPFLLSQSPPPTFPEREGESRRNEIRQQLQEAIRIYSSFKRLLH